MLLAASFTTDLDALMPKLLPVLAEKVIRVPSGSTTICVV